MARRRQQPYERRRRQPDERRRRSSLKNCVFAAENPATRLRFMPVLCANPSPFCRFSAIFRNRQLNFFHFQKPHFRLNSTTSISYAKTANHRRLGIPTRDMRPLPPCSTCAGHVGRWCTQRGVGAGLQVSPSGGHGEAGRNSYSYHSDLKCVHRCRLVQDCVGGHAAAARAVHAAGSLVLGSCAAQGCFVAAMPDLPRGRGSSAG